MSTTGWELQALRSFFRARGLRLTPQRQQVVEAIAALRGHFSVLDVHHGVVEALPSTSISTVYRVLDLFEELGLVMATNLPDGSVRYHRAEEAGHQHLVCRQCGADAELLLGDLEPLITLLRTKYGFEPEIVHTAILGHCQACQPTET
jgi:Fur family ferric uptake transcriptional regulator